MVVEREGKRARENGEQGGRPKRQKVAPRRFVEEFREEIEQVFAQADNEDVEGEEVEDLHTDEGEEHDFLDFLEDQAELITLYAAENELDHETAARQLFLEQEDGDGYESSFIDDDESEDGEFVDSESEESEESAEDTEETESSDTWKENVENGSTSDPDPELELELEE